MIYIEVLGNCRNLAEPLSEDARSVLAYLRDHPGVSIECIAIGLDFSHDRVLTAVSQLQGRALVRDHLVKRSDFVRGQEPYLQLLYPI